MERGRILLFSFLILVGLFAGIIYGLSFFSLYLAVPAAILLTAFVFFLLVYFWWAPNNLFFTFVPESWAKIVVKGDAAAGVLIQWTHHRLATASDATAGIADVGDVIEDQDVKTSFLGGLKYYGLWPIYDIYLYNFGWTNMAQDGSRQSHPKTTIDYVLLRDDVYYAEVKAAEDNQLIPLDIGLVLRLRVLNPYKALFRVQNWLETVINLVTPAVRDVLTTDSYENWIQQPKDLGEKVFEQLRDGRRILGELKSRYGIEMVSFGVESIDPTPVDALQGVRAASMKQYLADKEKQRIETEAEANRTRVETEAAANRQKLILEGQGEAERLKLVYGAIRDAGEVATLVRTLEALEKTPSAVGQVVLFPHVSGILGSVFPNRDLSSLTQQEIAMVRQVIAGLAQQGPGSSPPAVS